MCLEAGSVTSVSSLEMLHMHLDDNILLEVSDLGEPWLWCEIITSVVSKLVISFPTTLQAELVGVFYSLSMGLTVIFPSAKVCMKVFFFRRHFNASLL